MGNADPAVKTAPGNTAGISVFGGVCHKTLVLPFVGRIEEHFWIHAPEAELSILSGVQPLFVSYAGPSWATGWKVTVAIVI